LLPSTQADSGQRGGRGFAALAHARRLARAAVLASLLGTGGTAEAAQNPAEEAQAKASFLFNCVMFVDWPAAAIRGDEIVLGIAGADAVARELEQMQGRRVNGRLLRVRAVQPGDDVGGLHLLFLGGTDGITALLAQVGNAPVLTVGEHAEFTVRGGIVRVFSEQDRLRFEVNVTNAERAGLRVSARMLALAGIVR
jgi:hypothetical protein